ncbi:alcohol dehydrogenase catalytic domain-containing protein [Paenibacillus sp. P25]|nr:alcohol dehydrogenase catalytic domain-containing protein [Paenibacillus sp. P25]
MEFEDPQAGAGEVRVRVQAAGVQPADCAVRRTGWAPPGMTIRLPQILGNEFAGIVDQVGEGVTGFSVGGRSDRLDCPGLLCRICRRACRSDCSEASGHALGRGRRPLGIRTDGPYGVKPAGYFRRGYHTDPCRRRRSRNLRGPVGQSLRSDSHRYGERAQP